MKDLSVIIPCYNESGSLPDLINACRESCKDKDEVEFIFVNNGSTDDSEVVFHKLLGLKENNFAKLVNVPVNKGYGYGILQGLFTAEGKIISWTHADLQTNPRDVILSYEKYRDDLVDGLCIVKGKRIGRNLFDDLFTGGMSLISSLLLLTRLSDVNAQPKIFNRNFLLKLDKAPYDFSIDLYLLYLVRREKIKIESYPVKFEKRLFGEAKGGGSIKGKLKLIRRTFKYIFELRTEIIKGNR
jgi:glycosyltransferase involved in cell wall biosynthesis